MGVLVHPERSVCMPEITRTPNKLALLIGINEYVYADELGGCVNDALLIADILLNNFIKIGIISTCPFIRIL